MGYKKKKNVGKQPMPNKRTSSKIPSDSIELVEMILVIICNEQTVPYKV